MRFVILIGIIVLISSCTSLKSKKELTPPGTIWLKDNLYMDITEVTNVHYREFLWVIGEYFKDSVNAALNKLDTTVWDREVCYGSPYVNYYHKHPAYNFYPVVGVSYENALAFCKFRTEAVNARWNQLPVHPFPNKKVIYRLPTEQEWELAAMGGLNVDSFPFGFKDTLVDGRTIFNAKDRFYTKCAMPGNLRDVETYIPNKLGLKNMIGNVSEMTDKKGIAKGGNFTVALDSCKIKNRQYYFNTEVWLGFRCVAELVDK